MNYVDELNLLKSNVMNLMRSFILNVMCVNVVPKKNNLKLTIFYLYQARVEEQTKIVIFKYYVKHAI